MKMFFLFIFSSLQGSHSDFLGPTSGSTAVIALVRSDTIIVANAGDSRCVLSRGGNVRKMF